MKYEFEDEDTWDMATALSPAIRDAIKLYRKETHGFPLMEYEDVKGFSGEHHEGMGYISEDAWNHVLDEIIFTFDCISKDESSEEGNPERVDKGLKLFATYFQTMWN